MEKFGLAKLPELRRHPELKEYIESADKLIGAEAYRAASGELRQAVEYMVDCYMEEALAEGNGGESVGKAPLRRQIDFLGEGDWITRQQVNDFHEIRKRCNAGVHRNSENQVKQATPADIRYCYELLIQGLPEFFQFFPGEEEVEEIQEAPETAEAPESPESQETQEAPEAHGAERLLEAQEMPETEAAGKKPGQPGAARKGIGYSILEEPGGEASEDAFADMMAGLLKKMKIK